MRRAICTIDLYGELDLRRSANSCRDKVGRPFGCRATVGRGERHATAGERRVRVRRNARSDVAGARSRG
jgi:hypothetical protein